MPRNKEDVDPEEMNTHAIGAYVMVALAQLGGRVKSGNAGKAFVATHVANMLKDRLKPCDWKPMYKGPEGIRLAPVGYPGDDTFPVWENNASLSWKFAVIQGFVQTGKEMPGWRRGGHLITRASERRKRVSSMQANDTSVQPLKTWLRSRLKQAQHEILFRVGPKKMGRSAGQGTGGKD